MISSKRNTANNNAFTLTTINSTSETIATFVSNSDNTNEDAINRNSIPLR